MNPKTIPLFDRNRDHPPVPTWRPPERCAQTQSRMPLAAPAKPARNVLCVGHVRQFLGWKSPVQSDGGEALAKRKGDLARGRLKEAWSKVAT